jgi:hypothetical protein
LGGTAETAPQRSHPQKRDVSENQAFHLLQLRGVLVNIGGGEDAEDGGAGDSTNVSQTFQPSGRLSLANSP